MCAAPVDRREKIRVSCSIECTCDGFLRGRLLNLSVGGALLFVPSHFLPQGESLSLFLSLPGSETSFGLEAQVLQVLSLAVEGTTLRLRFLHVDESTSQAIDEFVLRTLVLEVTTYLEERGGAPGHGIEVLEPDAVRQQLQQLALDQASATLLHHSHGEVWEVRVDRLTAEGLVLRSERSLAALQPGGWVHLLAVQGHRCLHLYTTPRGGDGERVVLALPNRAFVYELRGAERSAAQSGMEIAIPLPYPPGQKLRRPVIDISETGLSFAAQPADANFFPGTPLAEVEILGGPGREPVRRAAEVMHVTPALGQDGQLRHLRIGLAFGHSHGGTSKGRKPGGNERRPFLPFLSNLLRWMLPGSTASPKSSPAPRGMGGVQLVRWTNRRREQLVGLVDMTRPDASRLTAPVVIIPPAHGKRKESTSGLALTLIHNFRKRNRDLVVLRYDGVNCRGESFKDPDSRAPGRESVHMTLSQAAEDIESALEFVHDNEYFTPTQVILLSMSLQGVAGRRAVFRDQGRRIHAWLGVMGAPAGQEVIRNASGGVDYIARFASGKRSGEASILGVLVDTDRFCQDALTNGLAFMADAKHEIGNIPIPVIWLCGLYDAWIDPATLREFMAVPAPGPRELVEVEAGHLPLNSHEALTVFGEATRRIWRFLFQEDIEPVFPPRGEFERIREREWNRSQRSHLPNKREYWQSYLLGDAEGRLGYDVLTATPEYMGFLQRQLELAQVQPGQIVADMGCGTGNLSLLLAPRLLGRRGHRSGELHLVDFVPEVLRRAQEKVQGLGLELTTRTHCLNLELSPERTLRRFLQGEFFSYQPLRRIFANLSDYSAELWKAADDWRLHELLRGRRLSPEDLQHLRERYHLDEVAAIVDVNRLARWALERWAPERSGVGSGPAETPPASPTALEQLPLERLRLRNPAGPLALPFADATFDCLTCSLVLSYLDNPLETLREFHRCLKPRGRIVLSSMQPDVDLGRIYRGLLLRLEQDPHLPIPAGFDRARFVEEVRDYVNAAAFLLNLAEEGQFAFFSKEELRSLVEQAGFVQAESFLSFGNPPQAHITVARR